MTAQNVVTIRGRWRWTRRAGLVSWTVAMAFSLALGVGGPAFAAPAGASPAALRPTGAGPAAGSGAVRTAAAGSATVRIGAAPELPKGAMLTGSATSSADGARLRLDVVLKDSDPAGLSAFDQAVSTPGSPEYHQFLSVAAYAATYDPTRAAVAAVSAALRSAGLSPGPVPANRLMIPVTATVSQASAAFKTPILDYRLSDGRSVYANTSAPSLPADVAGDVASVVGLDDLAETTSDAILAPKPASPPPRTGPFSTPAGPQPCAAARAGATQYGSYTINQLANVYGFTGLYRAGDLGTGQTIALFENDSFSMSDLDTYASCFGLQPARVNRQVSVVEVDGGAGAGPGEMEAALDVDVALGLAPDAHIEVYEGPNNPLSELDETNQIVSDDTAQVVSISLGLCEPTAATGVPGLLESEDAIFEQAAAQGQTVVAAAGDDGSEGCDSQSGAQGGFSAVDDPASQPYVTGVGGTDLTALTSPPSEVVWNEAGPLGGAGGGGFSNVWTEPAWQQALVLEGPEVALCGPAGDQPCRGVPDVAASSDPNTGYTVYYQGAWVAIGGTSGATPLWAALVALTNETRACGGVPLGYINPLLYQLGDAQYLHHQPGATYFDDITSGDNDYTGLTGEYPAEPGWDPATGLGSPVLSNGTGPGGGLAAGLCALAGATRPPEVAPEVSSVSPPSGTDKGGTLVTIEGTHLGGATAVTFGTVEAAGKSIVSDTPTQLEVTAPPSYVDVATGLRVDGVVRVTVTTPGGVSRVSPDATFTYEGKGPVVSFVTVGGPLGGGSRVYVTGSGFDGATRVAFGSAVLRPPPAGHACRASEATFCVLNDDTLTLLSPPARRAGVTAGAVAVVVSGAHGASQSGSYITPSQDFDYIPPPRVSAVIPKGPPAGGYTVTIKGAGFAAYCSYANPEPSLDLCVDGPYGTPLVSEVDVGTGARETEIGASQINVLSYSELTVTMPSQAGPPPSGPGHSGPSPLAPEQAALDSVPGKVQVRVRTLGGSSSGQFVYSRTGPAAPTVSSIEPTVGTTNGETPVHLTGTNFLPGMTVTFGGIPSNDVLSVNASGTAATVLSPANGSGLVPVDVTTPWGSTANTDSFVGPNQFTYVSTSADGPTVLAVEPDIGPAKGGTRVTITGSGFFDDGPASDVSAIEFGGVRATQVSCELDTACQATVPPHRAGVVAVTVTDGSDQGGLTSSGSGGYDRFTYAGGPGITGIQPSRGPAAGGTLVTITGFDLSGASKVSFGSVRAETFACASAHRCTATSPPGSAGEVAVVVTTPAGTTPESSASQFEYLAPTVTDVAPDQGPASGGTEVLVTGSGFDGATSVHFGAQEAESFTCSSDTSCIAVSPPDPTAPADMMGQVDVTVTSKGVTSIDTPSDQFTYVKVS